MGSSPKPGADRLSVPPEAVGAFSSLLPRLFSDALPVRRYLLASALAACGGDARSGFVRRRTARSG
jgi:hypothetical protein